MTHGTAVPDGCGAHLEPLPQTNLQLYAQLRRAGWPQAEIEAVGRTYELAMVLLTGQYRASGKPQVDHLVGTAGMTCEVNGRPPLVRAALLHNAYSSGVWKDGRPRATRRRRRKVVSVIGAEAEGLVFAYGGFLWDDSSVRDILDRVHDLVGQERDLVVLRLANEIDSRSDLALSHSGQVGRILPPMVELADRIGEERLAERLLQVAEDEEIGDVEPGLRTSRRHSALLAPLSHRRRWTAVTTRHYRRGRSRARRVLRRLG